MPKGVAGDPLGDLCSHPGLLDRALQDGRVLVVADGAARARVPGETHRGEDPLPPPVASCRRILSAQGIRERDLSVSLLDVALVKAADLHQVALERPAEASREGRHPVAPALSLPDRELRVREVEVLDPQPQTFQQTETGSVEQRPLYPAGAMQLGQHRSDLFAGQHHGQYAADLCADSRVEAFELPIEDVTVEKEECTQRLVLGAGTHSPADGEIREEGHDLDGTHLFRVALVVKENETPHPADVGLLGAEAVVAPARSDTNAVQELRWLADGRRFGGHRGATRDRSRGEVPRLRLAAQAGKARSLERPGYIVSGA